MKVKHKYSDEQKTWNSFLFVPEQAGIRKGIHHIT
jgi:hypothetical protein